MTVNTEEDSEAVTEQPKVGQGERKERGSGQRSSRARSHRASEMGDTQTMAKDKCQSAHFTTVF